MIVRRERPADVGAVDALHRAAFPTDVEARLLAELREDAGFLPHLSLVAVDGDDVVGHVVGTRGRIEPHGVPAVGLGPLGVRPDRQGRGIGAVLVHALVAVAEATGESLVALLGDPAFYSRAGFVRASELGVEPPDPAWGAHFQARRLGGPEGRGTFRYAAPFDRL
ncbi:N-acetyltransferase [Geodermatophilus aquaeductus]|uniref:Putative acetyltransferase n=1 Tax=Geodermatophilus aquaeductus TaxID=1564161 RepID=A0A521DML2_9ACTN|nr:N-acetyltransferase [Geodermatophilus aquaeductus]SMO72842.1 putative acetyltransferase [Geodermatophilus aquaeductus]